MIAASQGTRFAVTFNNLNPGVNYYVPGTVTATAGTYVLTAFAGATGTTPATTVTAGTVGSLASQVLLTVANGSATIYYGTTTSQAAGTPSVAITLSEVVPSASAVTSVSGLPVTASVALVGVATGYPQFAVTATPTISQTPASTTTSVLTACSTTLLFPYVVNTGGYDTGIAIANASTGVTGFTPTAGSCTVSFYGDGAPASAYSTGTIPTAKDAVFVVSDKAPGLSGYAVATCNFQGAHGYAFITDGFGGGGRGLAADYLAVVTAAQGLLAGTVQF